MISSSGRGDENAPDHAHRPNRVQIGPDIDLFLDEGLPECRLGNGTQDGFWQATAGVWKTQFGKRYLNSIYLVCLDLCSESFC